MSIRLGRTRALAVLVLTAWLVGQAAMFGHRHGEFEADEVAYQRQQAWCNSHHAQAPHHDLSAPLDGHHDCHLCRLLSQLSFDLSPAQLWAGEIRTAEIAPGQDGVLPGQSVRGLLKTRAPPLS
ncbi:MAG: hypothetical protein AB7S38_08125 [Vulcanimicrobiota bacterium]